MKILIQSIFFSVILFGSFVMDAQVFAPDLLCLKTDTIRWDIPSNNCGVFNQYEIYWSTDLNSSFQLLTAILDQNQTSYIDENPVNETRYYFMNSNLDCPGETNLNSDTISNQPLERPFLQFVSVENNAIHIQWTPSLSPQTKSYVIYRVQSQGTYPIDTVNINEYTDLNSDGKNQSEIYFVVGLDACDNTSIFGKPHFSTFLEGQVDPCTNGIHLKWNPYQNSIYDIDHQEVWVDDNGWKLWGSVPAGDSTFVVDGLDSDRAFDLQVKTIEKTTGFEINSNVVTMITNPLAQLTITNISISDDNDGTIDWIWNDKTSINQLKLSKNENLSTETLVGIPNTVNKIVGIVSSSKNTYQLVEDRGCTENDYSNKVSNIFLTGNFINASTNQLAWTPFDIDGAVFTNYEIYRLNSSSPLSIQHETLFVDKESTENGSSSYYVVGVGEITLFDGTNVPIRSQSNTINIKKEAKIFLPNAFAPLGTNRFFKPKAISSENIEKYEMYIYNRWGQEIFFSDDIEIGWDGYYKGKLQNSGVYTYAIQFSQNSLTVVKKGVVMLIN